MDNEKGVPQWTTKIVSINEVKPCKRNPRKLKPTGKQELTESLERFGLAEPIICNLDGEIIGGHQRYAILKAQGVKEIPINVPDRLLEKDEVSEFMLRLNHNAGTWDLRTLRLEFPHDIVLNVSQELRDCKFQMVSAKFDDLRKDIVIDRPEQGNNNDDDEPDEETLEDFELDETPEIGDEQEETPIYEHQRAIAQPREQTTRVIPILAPIALCEQWKKYSAKFSEPAAALAALLEMVNG